MARRACCRARATSTTAAALTPPMGRRGDPVVPFSADLSRGEADGFGCKVRLSPHQLRKRTSCLNLKGTMSESLSVELSSRLIVNDLRLTAALNASGGLPCPARSRSQASARKGSRSGPTSSNSESDPRSVSGSGPPIDPHRASRGFRERRAMTDAGEVPYET